MSNIAAQLIGRETGGKVLVADDEKMNRALMNDLLGACGFEILLADAGAPALEIAERESPDAILLDVMMPEMDGFEVCRQLKAREGTRHIPVLMVTALTDRNSRIEGIEAGANDFITKPVDARDIPLRVRNAVVGKNLYDQLQGNCERLIELENARERLTNMVVHDMRSPLLGISGMLQLLQLTSADSLEGDAPGYVDNALAETGRLVDMINSLLDISRMEKQQMPLDFRPNDLERVAQSAIGSLGALAHNTVIQINNSIPPQFLAPCDSEVIRRVIANLVSNSLKFTPRIDGLVQVELAHDTGTFVVAVRDNGPGIPLEDQARVFEMFGQSSNQSDSSSPSTGIGLTFCKLAIEAHAGTIGVQSEPGQGTTVWFQIPGGAPL